MKVTSFMGDINEVRYRWLHDALAAKLTKPLGISRASARRSDPRLSRRPELNRFGLS
jgi:hypothetical protein